MASKSLPWLGVGLNPTMERSSEPSRTRLIMSVDRRRSPNVRADADVMVLARYPVTDPVTGRVLETRRIFTAQA